jgi:peptide/nickel transport system permease protein
MPRSFLQAYGLLMVGLIVVLVVCAPLVTGRDPAAQDFTRQLRAPAFEHLLGTDQFGRDMFTRVLYGGRISILVSLMVVVIGGSVGILVGAVAGYAGGWLDELLMRLADIFLAFPPIVLALVVAGAMGPSLETTAVAIAVAWWPIYARILRGEVLSIREREYVLAAQTLGVPAGRILFGTVLPNSVGALKVVLVLDVGYAMVAAATLSFLGLGISPPTPEWGLMIREALARPSAWWLFLGPGVAIILFVSALNFAGSIATRSDLRAGR